MTLIELQELSPGSPVTLWQWVLTVPLDQQDTLTLNGGPHLSRDEAEQAVDALLVALRGPVQVTDGELVVAEYLAEGDH
jgi:hypothetical protein